jgi:hypothetical protein
MAVRLLCPDFDFSNSSLTVGYHPWVKSSMRPWRRRGRARRPDGGGAGGHLGGLPPGSGHGPGRQLKGVTGRCAVGCGLDSPRKIPRVLHRPASSMEPRAAPPRPRGAGVQGRDQQRRAPPLRVQELELLRRAADAGETPHRLLPPSASRSRCGALLPPPHPRGKLPTAGESRRRWARGAVCHRQRLGHGGMVSRNSSTAPFLTSMPALCSCPPWLDLDAGDLDLLGCGLDSVGETAALPLLHISGTPRRRRTTGSGFCAGH